MLALILIQYADSLAGCLVLLMSIWLLRTCSSVCCCGLASSVTSLTFMAIPLMIVSSHLNLQCGLNVLSYFISLGWPTLDDILFSALVGVYCVMCPLVCQWVDMQDGVSVTVLMVSMPNFVLLFFPLCFLCGLFSTASQQCRGQDLACIECAFCIGEFLTLCTETILIVLPHPL